MGALTPYVTDSARELTPGTPVTGGNYEVPPRSVVTLVGTLNAAVGRIPTPKPSAQSVVRLAPVGKELYEVRCGLSEPTELHLCNSHFDMPYGTDPGTGYTWGYRSYGKTGARSDLGGSYPGVRWEDGDTPGEGLTYQFSIPDTTRACQVEITLLDPWNAPQRRMDVNINGKRVALGVVPGNRPLVSAYTGILPIQGQIIIQVVRTKESRDASDDPLISAIKIQYTT